ncbi:YaeQ family protein [Pseudoxanthomonas dokdonensis]|uniref:YaeQ family protein n=1 Tax=Pseudoxanthomonas dokdonensis TaxID=344882 RepID=A0A0R0CT38_9GAMM|nr:YaeQ family protein [Pseudoxanthomonas dokdonensis]KRG68788.1 hypothetical protein ABB29_09840 [Pseudoxanthomonas dokdonensis]
MAPKSTVVKAELQISDMDRHHYGTHPLTMAQHPSETDTRLLVRLLAFALLAEDRLEFGKGLSTEEEPDLWRRDYTGDIEQWVDLGQPDESRIRKACGRAREVVVINYGGRAADLWWEKNAASLARHRNLSVLDISAQDVDALLGLLPGGLRLSVMIQDGEVQLMNDASSITIIPRFRQRAVQAVH